MTFKVGKLDLAVRIEQVQKVVNLPTIHESGINPAGLALIGSREITVVDLYPSCSRQRRFKLLLTMFI
jgi:purine-binding chemotaxis protein CheW